MRVPKLLSPLHQGLFIGLLLLLLGLSSTYSLAAPPAQVTPDPSGSATPEPTPQATETPRETPTVAPQQQQTETPTPIPPACAIEGYVFVDLNRDQIRQDNEPGLQTRVFLLPAEGEDTPIDVRTTNEQGFFCFETGSVPPGRYRLRQEKVTGYETTGGQDRLITVNANATTEVFFANVEVRATPTPAPTFTAQPTRPTATPGPTFTPTFTPTPTPSTTPSPSITLTPSVTPSVSQTPSVTLTPTLTQTPSVTPTTTRTPSVTPTGTLRALTPIATFITTTPGVLVTTTPLPGGPIDRLPDTGSGNALLLVATGLGTLMLGAGLARRLFFGR